MLSLDAQHAGKRYRIIVLRTDASKVLLLSNGSHFALPEVEIPAFQRAAERLTAAVQRECGQPIVCLFPLATGTRYDATHALQYYVAEAVGPQDSPRLSSWVSVDLLHEESFRDPNDYDALRASLARCSRERPSPEGHRFERLGWFSEVQTWIAQAILPSGLRLRGPFRQWNAHSSFSLIRFETTGPALWFKAVGEPNLFELQVSRCLARFYPGFVPEILAVHEDWNAWLTVEVQGTHLDETSGLSEWTAAAKTLANLQICSMSDTLHLIEAGCRDVRVNTLVDRVDPLLDVLACLMSQQTNQLPAPLSREELSVLGTQLKALLSAYASLDIPNTLGHLDFNPGNIITSREHSVFLDWADGSVGPPFPTLQFLLERLRRFRPSDEFWKRRLLSDYSERWESFLAPRAWTEALALTPLLAVFTYAVAQNSWRDPHLLEDPHAAKLLRSLGRRMKLEADQLSATRLHSVTSTLEVF